MTKIQGSIVALITPMDAAGQVDFASFENLLQWHREQGSHGAVVLGTTGESATIDSAEREELIRRALAFQTDDFAIIIGTGTNSTQTSVKLTQQAAELGAKVCMAVVPYYNKPTQEGLYQHFKAIASAVDIPVLLYNVPGRTVVDLQDETIARLAQLNNIAGIKDASGNIKRVPALREHCGKSFALLTGDDKVSLDFLLAGGDGVISVTANVAPKQMSQMVMQALSKQNEQALSTNTLLDDLHRVLFIEANPIPTKWALALMGMIQTGIRLPLTPLSEEYHKQVKQALVKVGVLSE